MKKLFAIGLGLFLLAGVVESQLITTTSVVTTNAVFNVNGTISGGDAVIVGTQLAAMTNSAGTNIFSGPALQQYFGTNITRQMNWTVVNNPVGGTNKWTIYITFQ